MDFNPVAKFLGEAYLRQAFAVGTAQEVEFLMTVCGIAPGMRVLDAGCGPGRHAIALAEQGCEVVGLDLSPDFIEIGRQRAADAGVEVEFRCGDVLDIDEVAAYDAVISLCQGGFGLLGGVAEEGLLRRFATALRPGGIMVLETFSAAFAYAWHEAGESLDLVAGTVTEQAEVMRAPGEVATFELVTTVFTPRELRLLLKGSGFCGVRIGGCRPGAYGFGVPTLEHPSLLCLAFRNLTTTE